MTGGADLARGLALKSAEPRSMKPRKHSYMSRMSAGNFRRSGLRVEALPRNGSRRIESIPLEGRTLLCEGAVRLLECGEKHIWVVKGAPRGQLEALPQALSCSGLCCSQQWGYSACW